jgi:hypothetical protein
MLWVIPTTEVRRMTIGTPPDPAYAPFVEGLKRVASDVVANGEQYWHPATSKWYPYPHADWILDESGLARTTDSSAIGQPEFKEKGGKWVTALHINDGFLGGLFTKVRDAYTSGHAAHPKANLVWHPAGGYWRNAIKRTAAGGSGWDLPPEAIKRLEEVDKLVRDRRIDHATGEQRKLEIIAEYRPPAR